MPRPQAIEYNQASDAVKAVYDEIKSARKLDDVNNFWKYLANDAKTLRRTAQRKAATAARPRPSVRWCAPSSCSRP